MACVGKMNKVDEDSEREEGEIVDGIDDLSDISSEEEFLLRQRLEVLENYNNVLERKKAKRSSIGRELNKSHLSVTKEVIVYRHEQEFTSGKHHSRTKRKKDSHHKEIVVRRDKYNRKKKKTKKKLENVQMVKGSSDESEDEYKNKRKKLAEAVAVNRGTDKSSLSARLHKMIHWSETHINNENEDTKTSVPNNHISISDEVYSPISSVIADEVVCVDEIDGVENAKDTVYQNKDISTDDEVQIVEVTEANINVENTKVCQEKIKSDSDEDLESLRQDALKSKTTKSKTPEQDKTEHKPLSEDEDSDTAELRIICLKSALLKKAIEMKQKQKMQKKLSQSSNIEDDLLDSNMLPSKEQDNNTDTESVDMDMCSDTEEKMKEGNLDHYNKCNNNKSNVDVHNVNSVKEDELDDDEDLLRAKLLTSLSKNLSNLVSPEVLKSIDNTTKDKNSILKTIPKPANVPEAKKFIIKVDESDSEGENEATENLTKMHMKLSEKMDFQQKLDLFLKSARMEVEKSKLPDVVQQPSMAKKPVKFVAKAVNNLPKSEQIEYKNLVKRMAELEKMKQTRQATLNLLNKQNGKEALKPRTVTVDSQAATNLNLEEQIAKSRKIIAEESAKMLKLKEEATKLSQRYKIAATELKNISTAITLNRRQQKAVQISLNKIRHKHQTLLLSSTPLPHSSVNGHMHHIRNKSLSNNLLKENNSKDEYKDPVVQKTVKVSVVNDFVNQNSLNNTKLSVQLDVMSNKKVVKVPDTIDMEIDQNVHVEKPSNGVEIEERLCDKDSKQSVVRDSDQNTLLAVADQSDQGKGCLTSVDDYKSPLDALGSNTWQADPNAILCPFEVAGQCKDLDCKYLHTLSQ